MGNVMVDVNHVSIRFIQNQEKVDNLKEYFIKLVTRKLKYDDFWALTDVNFQIEKGERLAFPDSVVSYFKGMMGQPAWGFPKELQKVVLKGEEPITCRPGKLLPPVDFDAVREEMRPFMGGDEINMRAMLSYCLYPKVYELSLIHI